MGRNVSYFVNSVPRSGSFSNGCWERQSFMDPECFWTFLLRMQGHGGSFITQAICQGWVSVSKLEGWAGSCTACYKKEATLSSVFFSYSANLLHVEDQSGLLHITTMGLWGKGNHKKLPDTHGTCAVTKKVLCFWPMSLVPSASIHEILTRLINNLLVFT